MKVKQFAPFYNYKTDLDETRNAKEYKEIFRTIISQHIGQHGKYR